MKKAGLKLMSLFFTVMMAGAFTTCLMAQSVPMGINYQAVARDANGNELINRNIDVRLSIISGSPAGEVEWEEVHSEVTTSQFGLFNIVIGQGIYSNGTVSSFEDMPWGDDLHFLKVEIKFDNEYLTMGTMQFLSVPYALYAQKTLEPGPQGPPGPAGDPASDDQVLFYDPQSHILSLENDDNPVDLSGLINDADADPDNELQILNLKGNELQIKTLSDSTLINTVDIDASPVNEIQYLSIQGYRLSLSQGNFITLPDSVKDDDADPDNEIQDLRLTDNTLKVTNNPAATDIDLSVYLDNTDQQDLSLNMDTLSLTNGGKVFLGGYLDNTDQQNLDLFGNLLTIENGNTVALNYNDTSKTNELQVLSISNDTIYLTSGGYVKLPQDNIDDADADPGNELITNVALIGTDLEITDAGGTTTVDLSSLENIPLIGFRAEKTSTVPLPTSTDTTFLFNDVVEYNDGGGYNPLTGIFTAPTDGIYAFRVNYIADGNAQILYIYCNSVIFETLNNNISANEIVYSAFFIKLTSGQTVRIVLFTGFPNSSGTGSFTGFRIH